MALWLIRAGKHGEDEATALNKGMAIIGWREMPDLSNIQSYDEMKQKYIQVINKYLSDLGYQDIQLKGEIKP